MADLIPRDEPCSIRREVARFDAPFAGKNSNPGATLRIPKFRALPLTSKEQAVLDGKVV
jgi:hypothetical protein